MARLRVYYVDGTDLWVDPPDPSQPITDPAEHFAMVEKLKGYKDKLKQASECGDGCTNDLPRLPNAPMIEERPFRTSDGNTVSISFPIYCGDVLITNTPSLVPYPEKERAQGIMWAEKLPDVLVEREPPRQNIEMGWSCEKCRRFDYDQGQEWVSRETHSFQKGEVGQMNKDIVRLAAEGSANATMPKVQDFGYCPERQALVLKTYPGCSKFVERKSW